MKIALLGYGKMGQIIERIAQERGHEIVLRKRSTDNYDGLELADVAIDFSVPTAAITNIKEALKHNVPVICGTTGWLDNYSEIESFTKQYNGAFLYASNFSLGVNIFFELNSQLAKLMSNLPDYTPSMKEIHHTRKLDAPSGTAITLAEDLIKQTSYEEWTMDVPNQKQVKIESDRIGDVPGTHIISWESKIDQIQIKHTAHNREGFALGSIVAAEWIKDKQGIFTMKDVLNLQA